MGHTFSNVCPTCGALIPVSSSQVDQQVTCFGCGRPFIVTAPAEASPAYRPAVAPPPAPPRARRREGGFSKLSPIKRLMLFATFGWVIMSAVGAPLLAYGSVFVEVMNRTRPSWIPMDDYAAARLLGLEMLSTAAYGCAMVLGFVLWFILEHR